MFVDRTRIRATGGAGGNGCCSFRREKYVPHGGPNGGDGGNGGSIYCQVDEQLNTLLDLAGKRHWKAASGEPGKGTDRHGKNAPDKTILVPPGTIVYDQDLGIALKDLVAPGECICLAHGGKGGRGNAFFKSATNQAPRQFEFGQEPQIRNIRLELKLIADVGLVGKPNAGKSTILSRLSAAHPKIADYPFTTLQPQLGIVELSGFRRLVMADIPGLIEGAHSGAGLGDTFLRHIERTRLVVHVVDIAPLVGDPIEDYRTIRNELAKFSPVLAAKRELVVANKMDLTGAEQTLRRFRRQTDSEVLAISGVTGKGLTELTERIWSTLQELPDEQQKTNADSPGC